MVNYMDPQVMMANAALFAKILIVLLGFYGWETLMALPFDWEVLSRKRQFKWPMLVYWFCKYTALGAIIALNISTNASGPLACQQLYTFIQFGGNSAIGAASTLLMLRTVAIWSKNIYVLCPLVILALGQWGILLHGMTTVSASWSEVAGGCVIVDAPPIFIQLIYTYTMAFDFVVLILSTIGLMVTPGRTRSGLWNLLFQDGLVYFLIAFSANTVPVIMLLLNLNPVLNVIAAVPACMVTSTVACRAFVRLNMWSSKDVYVHSSQVVSSTKYTSRTVVGTGKFGGSSAGTKGGSQPFAIGGNASHGTITEGGVHIQMESYLDNDKDNYSIDMESQNHRREHDDKKQISFGPEL